MNLETFVPKVTGTFQYYARSVDGTMLLALSAITSEQENPTNTTMKNVKKFLNYLESHQDVIVMYHESDMIL